MNLGAPPTDQELEVTLLGPGYGESVVVHVGHGTWVVVDSLLDSGGNPVALSYLRRMGISPAEAVALIVATHWHDDHIRGIARLVEQCADAQFCCAGVLCQREFLTLVGQLEGRHNSTVGSGLREFHRVFSHLETCKQAPTFAHANRVLLRNEFCSITSLSPGDGAFQKFLAEVGKLIPGQGENKRRISTISPNEVAVALWVECAGNALLLGSDLERSGWIAILEDRARPPGKASLFKIPHHGSKNANEPAVWEYMLKVEPHAVLAPWRRGGRALPTVGDVERIKKATPNAWITTKGLSNRPRLKHQYPAVEKTLRESGSRIRRLTGDRDMIRLRCNAEFTDGWTVELFGGACHLADYAA